MGETNDVVEDGEINGLTTVGGIPFWDQCTDGWHAISVPNGDVPVRSQPLGLMKSHTTLLLSLKPVYLQKANSKAKRVIMTIVLPRRFLPASGRKKDSEQDQKSKEGSQGR